MISKALMLIFGLLLIFSSLFSFSDGETRSISAGSNTGHIIFFEQTPIYFSFVVLLKIIIGLLLIKAAIKSKGDKS